jgi:hypothetical protein
VTTTEILVVAQFEIGQYSIGGLSTLPGKNNTMAIAAQFAFGGCAVPVFRFYIFEKNGHVTGPRTIYELPNEAAAVEEGTKLLDDRVIEIWWGTRKVDRLDRITNTKTQKR